MDTKTDWQLNCNDNNQRLGYMFKHSLFTDCKFLVGLAPNQEVIEAHKAILASASPVFTSMFYGTMAERQSPIPIVDIQPETFRAMLTNIYSETVPITSLDGACDIYCAADKYSILALKKKCVNYIESQLTIDNVCKIYEFASLYEDKFLMDRCVWKMGSKTRQLLKDKSFLEAPLSTVEAIFSMESMSCNELDLFQALEMYVKAQEQRLKGSADRGSEEKSIGHVLLKKIRFLTLSSREFALGPAKSDLLTESEVLAILMNLAAKESHIPMPSGFSTSRTERSGYW